MTGHAMFVIDHAVLADVPMLPGVLLYQAEEAFGVWEETERAVGHGDQAPPFWAFPWPGGLALARYVLDHPESVARRTVLDIGSGSGLTAIAAAMAGASSVLASELDPFAAAAITLNAEANGVTVRITGDVLDGPGEGAEVVLAGDVWYEERLAERVFGLLRRARARGAQVLVGDVGRKFLPSDMMRELASYDVPVIADLEDATIKRARVMTLR